MCLLFGGREREALSAHKCGKELVGVVSDPRGFDVLPGRGLCHSVK